MYLARCIKYSITYAISWLNWVSRMKKENLLRYYNMSGDYFLRRGPISNWKQASFKNIEWKKKWVEKSCLEFLTFSFRYPRGFFWFFGFQPDDWRAVWGETQMKRSCWLLGRQIAVDSDVFEKRKKKVSFIEGIEEWRNFWSSKEGISFLFSGVSVKKVCLRLESFPEI